MTTQDVSYPTRRGLLAGAGATLAGATLLPPCVVRRSARFHGCSGPMCLLRPRRFLETLRKMFDQIGGLGRIVKGKTVAVKLNMVGSADPRAGYIPIEKMVWVHPDVIGATVHLLARAGAVRIRLLEGPWKSAEPLEEYMISAGWEPNDFVKRGALG